jgi:hypothetical protein
LKQDAAFNLKHNDTMNEATQTVPRAPKEIKLSEKDIARFWSKVDKNGPTMPHMDSACWVWMAGRDTGGYGHLKSNARMIRAHRAAWVLANGQIPHDESHHGICVCHRCDKRACVNPSHLFLGSNTDNARDKVAKGRCNSPKGDANGARLHPEKLVRHYGEANGIAKLTAAQVIEIRALYAAGGIGQYQLAERFGVNQAIISRIIHRQIWKHIG